MKKVVIEQDDFYILDRLLSLCNNKKVIKLANYFCKYDGNIGNTCADFQNFMFEKFGLAFKDNLLTGENRKKVEEHFSKKNKAEELKK